VVEKTVSLQIVRKSSSDSSGDHSTGGPILQLQHLGKAFGAVDVLSDVTLEVQKGEFITLLGPSGCGKTTTLRIIAGFEQQTTGSIFLSGRCIDTVPPYRRDVHTVFQSYAIFPHMNVFENISFALAVKRLPLDEIRARTRSVLDLVGLTGLEQRRSHQLSGGQQQRVALARAIIDRPALLLLDEPFGALDLKLRKEMQTEIRRIHRQSGLTFIHVTHDQEEALTMSDRIAVMSSGRIVQIGSADAVYRKPMNTFVANFVGKTNLVPVSVLECNADTATVVLPTQQVTKCVRWVDIGVGGAAVLAVRPENLRLEASADAAAVSSNRPNLEGRVVDIIFAGPYVEVLVEVGGIRRVSSLEVASNLRRLGLTAGAPVRITWDPEDAFILPDGVSD
jgi:spermidine/putrescine transport system ATP-binding protein